MPLRDDISIDDSADGRGRSPLRKSPLRKSLLRKWAWRAGLVLFLAWIVHASFQITFAFRSATEGRRSIESALDRGNWELSNFDELAQGAGLDDVRRADSKFQAATARLGSASVAPLRVVPVLGRQLRSAHAISAAAADLTSSALIAQQDVDEIVSHTEDSENADKPRARLASAKQLEATLARLTNQVGKLEFGPDEGLLAPLREARRSFSQRQQELHTRLVEATAAVRGTLAFLEGPNRYLVLASNNSEMRAGSGMFLQAGEMAINDGTFDLSTFVSTEDLLLESPGTTLDPDLEDLWGSLEPTQEWRNINLTPRFEESARMAADMWVSAGHEPVDGVIALDVPALERLLNVTGPVQVQRSDGTPFSLDSDNVLGYLLLGQYTETDENDDLVEREQRRAHLSDVAKAIFESFNSGDVSLTGLMDALVDSGRGRHLMAWSGDRTQQSAWESLGITGGIPENALMVSVINRGGNKLDQFIEIDSELLTSTKGDMRRIEVVLTISNSAPTWLPRFVQGPVEGSDFVAGEYHGYLALTVPGGSGNPAAEGAQLVGASKDGEAKVIVAELSVLRDETTHVRITFDLPVSWKSIEVQPSARVPATQWRHGSETWRDTKPRTVGLKGE